MNIITDTENIKRIVIQALVENEYQDNTSYNDIAESVIRKLTNQEFIVGYQEWYEDQDSKTGWSGLGWFDDGNNSLEGHQLVKYIENDKHYNPIEAIFKK